MRHLVIGANGQVGEALMRGIPAWFDKFGFGHVTGTTRNGPPSNLDIAKPENVDDIIAGWVSYPKEGHDIVWLPAAATNVDWCEQEPEDSYETNVKGVLNVVNACNKHHIERKPIIVFFSTDYVFGAENDGPWDEQAPPAPVNEYGRQKFQAEHALATNYSHFMIIRTSWVFGPETAGKNFAMRLVKNMRENPEQKMRIPEDEESNPTYSPDLVEHALRVLWAFGAQRKQPHFQHVVNIAGHDRCSKYQWALNIANLFYLPVGKIEPVYSGELKRLAQRPECGGFKLDKLETATGKQTLGYMKALDELKKALVD